MRAQWMFIFILLFALITAIFAVINVEPVRVQFLFTQADIPLILVILSSTLLGGLIVGLIGLIRQFKLTRSIKQLEKQLQELKTGSSESTVSPAVAEPPLPTPPTHNGP
ncbi:lipopolysaccharide assembly protein LapA domain-containing protein [Paenibacillus sp. RC67]|uniref:LapA family protein n=1 Tax=Paenibacillus sp. RC67 TaxID=3039392 RepID=UPI0024AD8484|nr:lipopolysaccharide assembly protein LapA domain-containing protein [Paenibacillus sp. RC67]